MGIGFLVALLILAMTEAPALAGSPLEVAQKLAEDRFEDYTYGRLDEEAKTIDCTSFVRFVVEDLAARAEVESRVTGSMRLRLVVGLNEAEFEKLAELVESEDERIRGVQAALVEAGLGRAVDPGEAEPGDLVQYWYRRGEAWKGHAAIVERVDEKGRATLYGSHRTTLQRERSVPLSERQGGIGSGPRFDLSDERRKVFVVRWHVSEDE